MSKDKFFFEEDPEATEDTKASWEEHGDTFFNVLADTGVVQTGKFDMSPMTATVETFIKVDNKVVQLEYGIVGDDYVIHVTPIHAKKNLLKEPLYKQALYHCITELNKLIPYDVQVDIYKPQDDWQIKATSFLIRGGATAWNLDRDKIAETVIPNIMTKVTEVCMRA